MRSTRIIALLATLAFTACATYDPYTGEQKVSSTAKGAGVGAGVAAVIAYLSNRKEDSDTRRRRVLQAAGGGALAGGAIGYYMDHQEAKLRKQLRDTGVSVVRQGDHINLIMPGNVTFKSDSADINANFYPVLDSVALVLRVFNKTMVAVAGHTDNTGSNAYNEALSRRRANSVMSYLLTRQVLSDRFDIIPFGESQPIADNDTPAGREANRRVEITLLPISA